MKCSRKGTNERIKARLARHAELMAKYMAEGMSRDAASQKAYALMCTKAG